jgi:hypothetical protein
MAGRICLPCKEHRHKDCVNPLLGPNYEFGPCTCFHLSDAVIAEANKQDGMERSEASTPFWYRRAIWDALIYLLCVVGGEVSNVEVWERLGIDFPRELDGHRAATVMGPIMGGACKAGLMMKVRMDTSTLVTRHKPEVWVYESKIFGHDPASYPYRGRP